MASIRSPWFTMTSLRHFTPIRHNVWPLTKQTNISGSSTKIPTFGSRLLLRCFMTSNTVNYLNRRQHQHVYFDPNGALPLPAAAAVMSLLVAAALPPPGAAAVLPPGAGAAPPVATAVLPPGVGVVPEPPERLHSLLAMQVMVRTIIQEDPTTEARLSFTRFEDLVAQQLEALSISREFANQARSAIIIDVINYVLVEIGGGEAKVVVVE
ncbi:hypothetical protein CASFOL_024200 [Castilleja foliolosa]|uniref:Uncharacterized protein n=1 Tax=Castilleja foliolosa TaxID=1961234 RepID=A0ABD3CPE0_9LAMI